MRTVRDSVRSIASLSQLFEAILDGHVSRSALPTRPAVTTFILQGLVKANFRQLGDRGLLAIRYGADAVPPAATFVTKLLDSGLVYPVGRRFLFFHDAFEDWLAGPSVASAPGA